VEPVGCIIGAVMAFFNPSQFLLSVLYLEDATYFGMGILQYPLTIQLLRFCGEMMLLFAAALHLICKLGNDTLLAAFFSLLLISDAYLIFELGRFSYTTGQVGLNFLMGEFVSVLFLLTRLSYLLRK
jgi:hypothetical protein